MLKREGIREDFTKGIPSLPRCTAGRGLCRKSDQQQKGIAYSIFSEC